MKHELCLLHVGMHKTGTTTLQCTLAQELRSGRFCYLRPDAAPNPTETLFMLFRFREIETILRENGLEEYRSLLETSREQNFKALEEQMRRSAPVGILSAEMMSDMDEDEAEALITFCRRFYREIRVLAYIRPPEEYVVSMMAQKAAEGFCAFDPETFYPHYRARFEKFDRILGRNHVTLLPYGTLHGGDIVEDFRRRVGIDAKEIGERLEANRSLSLEALALVWFYRRYGTDRRPSAARLHAEGRWIGQLRRESGRRFTLDPERLEALRRRHREDIRWMEERLGAPLRSRPPSAETIRLDTEETLLALGETEARKRLHLAGVPLPETGERRLLADRLDRLIMRGITSEREDPTARLHAFLVSAMVPRTLRPPRQKR